MQDRLDVLLAAAAANRRRDEHFRGLAESERVLGAPRAPEYWYRRPQRFEGRSRPDPVRTNEGVDAEWHERAIC